MRIYMGTTATASIDLDVKYRCSKCGSDMHAIQTVTASAEGKYKKDSVLSEQANRLLQEKVINLLTSNDPHKYSAAEFTCCCTQCGYRAPWASMNYKSLRDVQGVCLGIFIISIFIHFANSFRLIFAWPLSALSLAGYIGIKLYIQNNTKKMEQMIAELPLEAHPEITVRKRGINKITTY